MSSNDSFASYKNLTACEFADMVQARLFQLLIIPAVLLIIIFQIREQCDIKGRQNFCGRVASIWPVDIIGHRRNRFSYTCAFSITAWLFLELMLGKNPLQLKTNVTGLNSLIKLATCVLLAIVFYPVFAAISSEDPMRHGFGAVYTWLLTVVFLLLKYPCQDNEFEWMCELIKSAPTFLCIIYLCFWFPHRLIATAIARCQTRTDIVKCNQEPSFEYQYVQRLINNKPAVKYFEPWRKCGGVFYKLTKPILKIYAPIYGFRYPTGVLTAVQVSLILLWTVSITVIESYYTVIQLGRAFLSRILHSKFVSLVYSVYNDTVDERVPEEVIQSWPITQSFFMLLRTIEIAMYLSFGIAFISTLISLLLSMRSYRTHMLQSYKGHVEDLPSVKHVAPRALVVAASKYVGYQFAYSLWGFVVQAFVVLLASLLVALLVWIIFIMQGYGLLLQILAIFGPMFAYIYGILIVQQILVHFVFLQKDDRGKRVLAIRRSRLFYNFQYFMVFTNSAVGLASCLLRMFKGSLFGAFTLLRLDMSVMSRKFEKNDNGFKAYVCMLALDNTLTNPVLVAFVKLMRESVNGSEKYKRSISGDYRSEENSKESQQVTAIPNSDKRKKLVRNRWQVAFTLVNNPYLCFGRKMRMKERCILQAQEKSKSKSADTKIASRLL